jgi:hypothetical protein
MSVRLLIGLLFSLSPLVGQADKLSMVGEVTAISNCEWHYQTLVSPKGEPIQLIPYAISKPYGEANKLFTSRSQLASMMYRPYGTVWRTASSLSQSRESDHIRQNQSRFLYARCLLPDRRSVETQSEKTQSKVYVWSTHPFSVFIDGHLYEETRESLMPFSVLISIPNLAKELTLKFKPWRGRVIWGIRPSLTNLEKSVMKKQVVKGRQQELTVGLQNTQTFKPVSFQAKSSHPQTLNKDPTKHPIWLKQNWQISTAQHQPKIYDHLWSQYRLFIPFSLIEDISSKRDFEKVEVTSTQDVLDTTKRLIREFSYVLTNEGIEIEVQNSLIWFNPIWSLEWILHRQGQISIESDQRRGQHSLWTAEGVTSRRNDDQQLIWEPHSSALFKTKMESKLRLYWSTFSSWSEAYELYQPMRQALKVSRLSQVEASLSKNSLKTLDPKRLSARWIELNPSLFQNDQFERPTGLRWHSIAPPSLQRTLLDWWLWLETISTPVSIAYPSPLPILNPLSPESYLLLHHGPNSEAHYKPILWSPSSEEHKNRFEPLRHWGYLDSQSNIPHALNGQALSPQSQWLNMEELSRINTVPTPVVSIKMMIKLQLDQQNPELIWRTWTLSPSVSPQAFNRLILHKGMSDQGTLQIPSSIPDQLFEFTNLTGIERLPSWWSRMKRNVNNKLLTQQWIAYIRDYTKKGQVRVLNHKIILTEQINSQDLLIPTLLHNGDVKALIGIKLDREVLISSKLLTRLCPKADFKRSSIGEHQALNYQSWWHSTEDEAFVHHYTRLQISPSIRTHYINKRYSRLIRRVKETEQALCIHSLREADTQR